MRILDATRVADELRVLADGAARSSRRGAGRSCDEHEAHRVGAAARAGRHVAVDVDEAGRLERRRARSARTRRDESSSVTVFSLTRDGAHGRAERGPLVRAAARTREASSDRRRSADRRGCRPRRGARRAPGARAPSPTRSDASSDGSPKPRSVIDEQARAFDGAREARLVPVIAVEDRERGRGGVELRVGRGVERFMFVVRCKHLPGGDVEDRDGDLGLFPGVVVRERVHRGLEAAARCRPIERRARPRGFRSEEEPPRASCARLYRTSRVYAAPQGPARPRARGRDRHGAGDARPALRRRRGEHARDAPRARGALSARSGHAGAARLRRRVAPIRRSTHAPCDAQGRRSIPLGRARSSGGRRGDNRGAEGPSPARARGARGRGDRARGGDLGARSEDRARAPARDAADGSRGTRPSRRSGARAGAGPISTGSVRIAWRA